MELLPNEHNVEFGCRALFSKEQIDNHEQRHTVNVTKLIPLITKKKVSKVVGHRPTVLVTRHLCSVTVDLNQNSSQFFCKEAWSEWVTLRSGNQNPSNLWATIEFRYL